jgi:hypothetical protein
MILQASPNSFLQFAAILTTTAAIYAIYRVERLRTETLRLTAGEISPILVLKATKVIKIKNDEGDAAIRYTLWCKFLSEQKSPKLLFEYPFDGELKKIKAFVNGVEAKAEIDQLLVVSGRMEKTRNLPNMVRVIFDLKEFATEIGADFECQICLRVKGCFSNLLNEESSVYEASVPTKEFLLSLSSIKGLQFRPDSISTTVLNRFDMEDQEETRRVRRMHQPRPLKNSQMVIWSIHEPKLAARYAIKFQMVRMVGES